MSHITPGLMWKVYTLPPPLIPPLAVVGTSVAISATGVMDCVHPASEVVAAGADGYATSCLV